MKTIETPMKGQENWTNGNQLRWVVETSEQGPAKVYHRDSEVFSGTYKAAVAWLEARGNKPLWQK